MTGSPAGQAETRRLRILVADDDREMRAVLRAMLAPLGAVIVEAEDGLGLVSQIAEGPPLDLIITDHRMPWMTGLQAAVSARRAYVGVPIIVISAFGDEGLRRSVEALGSAILLEKPVARADLLVAAESALAAAAI
jgi:CheY-like chemotaxis protein